MHFYDIMTIVIRSWPHVRAAGRMLYPLGAEVFKHFDLDEDGYLNMGELKRAFRAIGLKKRDGSKIEVDEEMFKIFDTNGDGKVSLEEFDHPRNPKQ